MGFSKISAERARFIVIQAYLKKQEKNQINNLTLHLKQLEKEEMKNPKVSRRKEIIKIKAEINAKETKETIAKINKAKSWFFEKINKIDKPLARLIKKKRENQINKIRNENGEITTDNTEIQRIIRDYYNQLLLMLLSHFNLAASNSVRPHRWQPTKLHCPWDSPGKNTGVGFFPQCIWKSNHSSIIY